ncbi:hypothetical protein [Minwuia sp.]|uniref:hypothetical protein n=1 Tax=Minwuia sp. TaxID=2493630 RepID=UPI003A939353
MIRNTYVVSHSISWAAQNLVDSHGTEARRLALANAQRMAEEGRMELTTMWELVQGAVGELLGDEPASRPLLN